MRRASSRLERVAGSDEGNISILSLGFSIFAILLVLVGAAATQLHLERMRLATLADEVALEMADSMDVPAFYAGDTDEPTDEAAITLAPGLMADVAQQAVADRAAGLGLDGAYIVSTSTSDGATATVTVGVRVYPLFGVDALAPWGGGITLTATASARAY